MRCFQGGSDDERFALSANQFQRIGQLFDMPNRERAQTTRSQTQKPMTYADPAGNKSAATFFWPLGGNVDPRQSPPGQAIGFTSRCMLASSGLVKNTTYPLPLSKVPP